MNGKLRGKLTVDAELLNDEDKIVEMALADEKIAKYVADGVKKSIFVPKAKLLNLVV